MRFVKELVRELIDGHIEDVGAMLAYYAILALFPMLVFVVTLASLVIDQATVQEGVAMATEAMPPSTRAFVAEQVARFMDAASANFAIGGAALALWGASRGAAALMAALNRVFGLQETRSWIRRQLTAVAVTLVVALLTIMALALLVVGPVAGQWVADHLGFDDAFADVWYATRWIGAALLVMVVWGIVYRFLPDRRGPIRIFTPGAVAGILVWLAISWGFSVYLSHFNSFETTYGALGTAIIFLTWLWLSNIALLFGAEVNDVLARQRT
ncbi:MAG: YihY/virulence factor BrkB family protein [Deltaproteobacteria bacterium]|nr:YihY/virulence factor BrkB family protein [Deltaproteobacteria bacterium]MCW5803054.1 YihY/virulence factor BrkB family protein [Deltaproteobacteria bacterium]